MSNQNIRLIGIFAAVAFLLLIPLVAGFPWSAVDFITASVLLLGTGLACEFVLRNVRRDIGSPYVQAFCFCSSSFGQNSRSA